MAIDSSRLSDHEKELTEALRSGRTVDFRSSGSKPSIRSEILAGLLGDSSTPVVRRVHIIGASFDALDLAGVGTADRPLPPLEFEECEFGEILLDQSTLGGLHVASCRLTHLSCRNVSIQGELLIVDTGPLRAGNEDRRCSADLSFARVEGDVAFRRSSLCLPPSLRRRLETDGRRRWALTLYGATVRGHLFLEPATTLHGGLSITRATIEGSVCARGSSIEDDECAVSSEQARVGGWVSLGPAQFGAEQGKPTRVSGEMDLFGIHCQGLNGEGLSVAVPAEGRLASGVAINLAYAVIDHHLYLTNRQGVESTIAGHVNLAHACCGGVTITTDRVFLGAGQEARSTAIWASGIRVLGSFELWTRCDGSVDLSSASIDGNLRVVGTIKGLLDCSSTHVKGSVHIGAEQGTALMFDLSARSAPAMNFEHATVEKAVRVNQELVPVGYQSPEKIVDALGPEPDARVVAARSRQIRCYPGWTLFDLTVTAPEGQAGLSVLRPPQGKPVLLTGEARILHEINAAGYLSLTDPASALEYLCLFSSHVWGEAGGFLLSNRSLMQLLGESPKSLPDIFVGTPQVSDRSGRFEIPDCGVIYDNKLFRAAFVVTRDGKVEMTSDALVREARARVSFEQHLRQFVSADGGQNRQSLPLGAVLEGVWNDVDLKAARDMLRDAVNQSDWPRISVNLQNCSLGSLEDEGGLAWGLHTRFQLNGLTVSRVLDVPSDGRKRYGAAARRQLVQTNPALAKFFDLAELKRNPLLVTRRRTPLGRVVRVVSSLLYALLVLPLTVAVRGMASVGYHLLEWVADLGDPIRDLFARERLAGRRTSAPPRLTQWFYQLEKQWPIYMFPHGRIRWRWLQMQYEHYVPFKQWDYKPQPFREFSRVYWQQGQVSEFRLITSGQRRIEQRRAQFPANVGWWLYSVSSDYGLRPGRAIAFMLICILGGSAIVKYANTIGLLVVDATPTATLVTDDLAGGSASPLEPAVLLASPGLARTEIPCGNQIVPFLYAADVFLPLVDLRQEMRCQIRSARPPRAVVAAEENAAPMFTTLTRALTQGLADPAVWSIGMAIYALLGWVVTSVVVLTITIAVRQHLQLLESS